MLHSYIITITEIATVRQHMQRWRTRREATIFFRVEAVHLNIAYLCNLSGNENMTFSSFYALLLLLRSTFSAPVIKLEQIKE